MSDVIEIGKEQAIALLKRAVEEKGEDFVYAPNANSTDKSCTYEAGGQPSCIVGYALSYVGVPVEKLAALDNADDTHQIFATGIKFLSEDGVLEEIAGVTLTPQAQDILTKAQAYQDDGESWGGSVRAAEELA